ncbi:hypothetical protein AB0H83_09635 [Dactylosporangium sp. NPDC050688]|uniref:hypothetical protein n=1 Tax=Dactylosporangium sp. NPDC050688 TaxID=3157217 RepID=UPI0033DADC8A
MSERGEQVVDGARGQRRVAGQQQQCLVGHSCADYRRRPGEPTGELLRRWLGH